MGREVKCNIHLKTEHLFEFLLYNTYRGFFGIISAAVIVFSIALLITGINEKGIIQKILILLILLVFLIVIPVLIYRSAFAQLKASPIYEKTLEYGISNEGIHINTENLNSTSKWNEIKSAVESKKSIILYSERLGAFILPKSEIGEDVSILRAIILKNMGGKKCNLNFSRKYPIS